MFVCLSVGLSLFVTGFKFAPVGIHHNALTAQILIYSTCYCPVIGRFLAIFKLLLNVLCVWL